MDNYTLGIDVGTTSVKVSLIDSEHNDILEYFSKDTNCVIPVNLQGANEQFVPTIISTVNSCVTKISTCLRKRVTKIGICGQMHGVLFWKIDENNPPWKYENTSYRIDDTKVSRLYTWQDTRCDEAFLASLPKPDSHIGISSGFGIATIFWLQQNNPEYLKKYNRSGLISTFLVAMLCNKNTADTSYQNAASWGYFNCRDLQWNLKLLSKANFPIELLPRVKPPGEIAGNLYKTWCDIPEGTPVGVDLGELQCSVISTLNSQQDAIFNISTSSQLAFIINNYIPPMGPSVVTPIYHWPYFNNQYVVVASSLNGGNVLVYFVNMLKGWISDMGESPENDALWKRLIDLGLADATKSNLEVKPTCLGERFDTELLASVSNVNGTNVGLGHVFRTICKGLIENIHHMLPTKTLKEARIRRIIGTGQGLLKNKILQQEIERFYQMPLVFEEVANASKGAAMAVNIYMVQDNTAGYNVKLSADPVV